MTKKIVWIIFGGKSPEHEVSINSARNVLWALDTDHYDPVLIGITKTWEWVVDLQHDLLHDELKSLNMSDTQTQVCVVPETGYIQSLDGIYSVSLDIVFPVLHGWAGEDGSIQWLLNIANMPYVGSDVLWSSMCMDKDVAKRLLDQAGVQVAPGVLIRKWDDIDYTSIVETYWLPLFVKPANAGSSVWVTRATNISELKQAIIFAFKYDIKVLVEQAIDGREIECAVLGNDIPLASICGEVAASGWHTFYSYESKYLDEDGSELSIPAQISSEDMERVQSEAIRVYTTLECKWLSRVDMFFTIDGQIICNEVNTLPGFTAISMYPKLREASGLWYTGLISKLIELSIQRHQTLASLQTSM